MNRQETKEDPQPNLEDFTVGKFANRQEAEIAAKFLKEASFPVEQIQIERLSLKQLLNLPESKKVAGGKGGAILGGALGITISLSISLIIESFPDAQISINLSPLLIVIFGGVLGALGLGLIGAISSQQVSKTDTEIDEDSTSFTYGLIITGTKEDLERAKQILGLQGVQV
ncbi:MAG: hypothetical protein ACRC1Z_25640 [Waterburya sp.]